MIERLRPAYGLSIMALSTVSLFAVHADQGLSTLKLERMDAVLFNEPQAFDIERHRSALESEKKLRDLRHDLGLPPTLRS